MRLFHVGYEFSKMISDFMKILYRTNELVSSEYLQNFSIFRGGKSLIDTGKKKKNEIWQDFDSLIDKKIESRSRRFLVVW